MVVITMGDITGYMERSALKDDPGAGDFGVQSVGGLLSGSAAAQ
jgi:hypothetical protein